MAKRKEIKVKQYDPSWTEKFEKEAAHIKKYLGPLCLKIEHIGSTSVPGMIAKEDIDILCEVKNLEKSISLLIDGGYIYKGELNIPLRLFYSKNTDYSKVNLHVVEPGHGFSELNLAFRDYLRGHKEACKEYSRLKEEILKNPDAYVREGPRFTRYGLMKDAFIHKILKLANYSGEMINFCLHEREWQAFYKLMKEIHYLNKSDIDTSYNYDFDHKGGNCFVYSKRHEIIGAAYVDKNLKLEYLALEPSCHGFGDIEKHFKQFIAQWCEKRPKIINRA